MFDPYEYRCSAGHPDPCPVCSGGPHLEEILQYEGANTVAAVIMETVTGTNGILVPPDGYLQSIREVCDRHGIVLIFDEVMAGFGRTGRWFACDHWDVVPDIMTVAKGINSGYVPLGAMIIDERLSEWVSDKVFSGGLTYSGHPLACAAGVASIEAFREEGIVENAAAMGERPRRGAAQAGGEAPVDRRRARPRALLGPRAREGSEDPRDARAVQRLGDAAAPIARLTKAAMERGLYLFVHWNVIMIAPPLTITREELDEGLGILDEVLAIADEQAGP